MKISLHHYDQRETFDRYYSFIYQIDHVQNDDPPRYHYVKILYILSLKCSCPYMGPSAAKPADESFASFVYDIEPHALCETQPDAPLCVASN